jgi:hypothetical protein
VPEVEFKEGDQIIVDDYLEQSDSFKVVKSQVCTVLVVGRNDLIVKSIENAYYPRIFTVSKKVCRRVSKRKNTKQIDIIIPQINDLVAGITSDIGSKKQEMHVGILEEIRHNNTSAKIAIIREGNKRTSISFTSLVVLERKK